MKIPALKCKICGDIIFSRSRHDFRPCSCGNLFIDGGFDYWRVGYKTNEYEKTEIELEVTKEELYQDWASGTDKFGLIKGKKGD